MHDAPVLPAFADRVLAVDGAVARRCARLQVPGGRAERDALIAATARDVARALGDAADRHG